MQEVASEFINIYNKNYTRKDYYFYDRAMHWEQPLVYETVEYLLKCIQEMRAEQYPEALQTSCYNLLGYVPRAEVLFLGDELNKKCRHDIWPFWEYGYSGLYMTKILDEIGFNETQAIWTNFKCEHDQFYLYDLVEYNKNLKVIALGKAHANKVRSAGIECVEIFHPSYAKRFNVSDYAQMVKEAVDAATT